MKKNITINIFGQLYNIDEDAYELLNSYEESLRQCFANSTDGSEIYNDIEARIAELFSELKAQGIQAITLEHVQALIKRIGAPEELGDDSPKNSDGQSNRGSANGNSSTDSTSESKPKKIKRLYRDLDDKVLFGVLSGLAHYFGGSATTWRLVVGGAFLLVFLILGGVTDFRDFIFVSLGALNLYWYPIIAYIVMAILIPGAKTPAEKLAMKGKEVNPQTLASEISAESGSESPKSVVKGCLNVFATIIGTIAQILGALMIIPFIGLLIASIVMFVNPSSVFGPYGASVIDEHTFLVALLDVSILLAVFIPAYASVHALLCKAGKLSPMPSWQRLMWLALFFVSVVGIAAFGARVNRITSQANKESRLKELHKVETSDDSIYLNDDDWEYLTDNGFTLLRAKNCRDERITKTGEYFNGNKSIRYFNAANGKKKLLFQAEKTDSVENGTYIISAIARADGNGVFIYAIGDEKTQTEVMPCGNTMGELWYDAKKRTMKGDSITLPEVMILNAHNTSGFGWSKVECKVTVSGGLLRYGVSTDKDFTGVPLQANWFSACDFTYKKIK